MTETVATFFTRAGSSPKEALGRKRALLAESLRGMRRTLVAYSGGVDSTLLLAEAHRVLGAEVLGVIADSPSLPRSELAAALDLARERGIPVRVIRTEELSREAYRRNGPDRCYHCKTELFEQLGRLAAEERWDTLVYGAVTDDLGDVRPGMAAAERLQIRAPLLEAGLGKLEIRVLARNLGLGVWQKPQSACLASRIPHGTEVTSEKLTQVELGEAALRDQFGLRVVRLRHEGTRARIETEISEIGRLLEPSTKNAIFTTLNKLGFTEVDIDPRGYRRPDPLPTFDEED